MANLQPDQAPLLARALAPTHACDESWIASAIARHGSFNALHEETGFKVDVFVPAMDGLAASAMRRRVAVRVAALGREVPVAAAEDVVIQKLIWFRAGGESSERQWLDVLGVLKLQGSALDIAYVRNWAEAAGIADLLERALAQSR